MTNIIPLRRPSIARLECSACGATADAACNCGAPYLPAGQRAAEAVTANPMKSDRAIADDIGVSKDTVRRARKTTGACAPVEKRTGRDGKTRKLPTLEPKPIAKPPADDPLVIPDPESPADQILPSPWFASVMRPVLAGEIKNDPETSVKAVCALDGFKRACANFLPNMPLADLSKAAEVFSVIDDMRHEVEDEAEKAKREKERIAYEKRLAKQPLQTHKIADLVDDSFSTFRELGEEVRQNAENMEEKFPTKAEQYAEAADVMENLNEPDVPESLAKMEISFRELPNKRTGREARCSDACGQLQRVVDHLEGIDGELKADAESLKGELEDVISEAENASFPGMYG
jgi:hypothetical protein